LKSKQMAKLLICLGIMLCIFLLKIYSDFIWRENSDKKHVEDVVHIWTIHGDTANVLRKVVKEYEGNNPNIEFDITVYKNEVYQAAVNNALMTDNLPDMFFWWGFSKLERLVDADMVYDITLELEKNQDIIEGGKDAFTFDGKTYALPLYGWTASLFCNQRIFEQNNLEYPTDYNQFVSTIRELQEKKEIPMITGAKEGWLSSLYYMSLVQGEETGKNIFQAVKNNALFLTPQFTDATYKLYNLVNLKAWQDNYLESDAYNAAYSFAQGNGAMLYYGSWATTLIEGESSKIKEDVAVIPFPNGNNMEGIGGFVDTFVINKEGVIPKKVDLINMYIDIMHEMSDLIVNEIGGGIPVYRDQRIDAQRFPLLYACWEINKNRKLYPAYDQIMSEELSAQYYLLLNELMAGEIGQEEFIEGLMLQ
jgi:ABC-type glycerol-3-phosphate transport system substrate-binding protein